MKNIMKHWRYCVSKASSQLNRLLHLRISSRRQRVRKSRHFNFAKSAKCTAMPIDYSKFDHIGDSDEEPAAQRMWWMWNTSNFVDLVQNDFRSLDQSSKAASLHGWKHWRYWSGFHQNWEVGESERNALQLQRYLRFTLWLWHSQFAMENPNHKWRFSSLGKSSINMYLQLVVASENLSLSHEKCGQIETIENHHLQTDPLFILQSEHQKKTKKSQEWKRSARSGRLFIPLQTCQTYPTWLWLPVCHGSHGPFIEIDGLPIN